MRFILNEDSHRELRTAFGREFQTTAAIRADFSVASLARGADSSVYTQTSFATSLGSRHLYLGTDFIITRLGSTILLYYKQVFVVGVFATSLGNRLIF